ncbi:MAG TPA: RNA 2'-phosphotransferase [Actinocrinis sp.]|nr:RNA 2'-phosphotransferase [Actinocrinis sp.]
MNDKELIKLSKRMSMWLRHNPADIGLTMDSAGWVDVAQLLGQAKAHGRGFTRAQLDEVVTHNTKQRFEFDGSRARIRARQGHSVEVELGYAAAEPPAQLYHGTAEPHVDVILREGLRPMSRHAVHLSVDVATARNVGERHGKPVVLVVDAAAMHAAGHVFQVTGNGVWLVDAVPAGFLQRATATSTATATTAAA